MVFQNIGGRLVDIVFGYDFFISYTWADGSKYARSLYEKLKAQGFTAFLDEKDFTGGDNWTLLGRRAVKKTRQLILVATPKVHESDPVLKELTAFQSTGRKIIPIEIGDSLNRQKYAKSPLLPLIRTDVLKIRQPLQDGAIPNEAAPEIIGELRRGFKHVRQAQIRVRVLLGACLMLLVLLCVAVWQGYLASANAKEAIAQRLEAQKALSESLLTLARQQLQGGKRSDAAVLFAEANVLNPTGYARKSALSLLKDLPTLRHIWPVAKPIGLPIVDVAGNPSSKTEVGISRMGTFAEAWWPFDEVIPPRIIRHDRPIRALALSTNGHLLITADDQGFARVWDTETLGPGPVLKHDAGLNFVSFSPNDKHVLTVDSAGVIQLWNASNGLVEHTMEFPGCSVVTFSADGNSVVAGSAESHDVRFWNTDTGDPIRPPLGHGGQVSCLAVSADNRYALTGVTEAKRVLLWDLDNTGSPKFTLSLEQDPLAVALDPNQFRAIVNTSESIQTFVLGKEEPEFTLYPEPTSTHVGFDAHGKCIWAAGPGDKLLRWDVTDGQELGRIGNFSDSQESLAWVASDGSSTITANREKSLLLHWTTTTAFPATIPLSTEKPEVAIDDLGRYLAVADGRRLAIYEAAHGRCLWNVGELDQQPWAMAFRDSGTTLEILHGIRGGIRIQKFRLSQKDVVETHDTKEKFKGQFKSIADWSDDFNHAVIIEKDSPPNRLTILDLRHEQEPVRIEFPGKPISALLESFKPIQHTAQVLTWAFTPDGDKLAVATADRKVWIINIGMGRIVRELPALERQPEMLAISRYSELVAIATVDLGVQIRDRMGKLVGSPIRIPVDPTRLSFSENGNYLFVCAGSTFIKDLLKQDVFVRSIAGESTVHWNTVYSLPVDYGGGGIRGHLLYAWDVATGLEIGSPVAFSVRVEPQAHILSAANGRVLEQQGKMLRVWTCGEDNPHITPQDLRLQAWVQTGLEVVNSNRVEQLSPSRWDHFKRTQANQPTVR